MKNFLVLGSVIIGFSAYAVANKQDAKVTLSCPTGYTLVIEQGTAFCKGAIVTPAVAARTAAIGAPTCTAGIASDFAAGNRDDCVEKKDITDLKDRATSGPRSGQCPVNYIEVSSYSKPCGKADSGYSLRQLTGDTKLFNYKDIGNAACTKPSDATSVSQTVAAGSDTCVAHYAGTPARSVDDFLKPTVQ